MNRNLYLALSSTLLISLSSLVGCTAEENQRNNETYAGCTIAQNDDHSSLIRCADGSEAIIPHGKDGAQGEKGEPGESGSTGDAPCTLTNNSNGTQTLTCGTNSVVLGNDCEGGYPGSVTIDLNGDSSDFPTTADFILFKMLGCNSIQGNLNIYHTGPKALDPAILAVIRIGGNLEVHSYHEETFELPSLQSVGDEIIFSYAKNITKVSFPALQSVGHRIYFEANDTLTNVSFPGLQSVGGAIFLANNTSLTTLSFPELTTLEGSLILGYVPEYTGQESANPALENLTFPKLKEIGQDLSIYGNNSLVTLEGLAALETISGNLTIAHNPVLEDIDDITGITHIEGNVRITDNELLDACPLILQIESLPGFDRDERDDKKLLTDVQGCSQ